MKKQMPGVKHHSVEVSKMFGKDPMAGSKKGQVSDGKPVKASKVGSVAKRLEGKRI